MSDAELTRWPGSPWPLLERGDLVNIKHGDFAGEFRVTDVSPGDDGGETYALEPAAEVMGRATTEAAGDICAVDPEVVEAFCRAQGIEPYDLTAEPGSTVFLMPGWAERLEELAPRAPRCRCSVLPAVEGEFSGTLYPGAAERLAELAKYWPEEDHG